jgi:hypothetical protein
MKEKSFPVLVLVIERNVNSNASESPRSRPSNSSYTEGWDRIFGRGNDSPNQLPN